MKLTTTARHFEASPELLEHTEKRLGKLKRFFDQILHVDVIMSVEKVRNIAEINVHVNGHDFTAQEESKDMKLSIDKAAKRCCASSILMQPLDSSASVPLAQLATAGNPLLSNRLLNPKKAFTREIRSLGE